MSILLGFSTRYLRSNMQDRLRLYDIFRVVSLQSCQHEYVRVHGSGSVRSVRSIHNGNVGGSDRNSRNGNGGTFWAVGR